MDDNKRRNLLIYLGLLIIVLTAFDLTLIYNRDHVYKETNNTSNKSNKENDTKPTYPIGSALCEQTGGTGFDTDACTIGNYSFTNDIISEKKTTTYTITNANNLELAKGEYVRVNENASYSFGYNNDGSVSIITGYDKTNKCYTYDRYAYDGTKLDTHYCVVGIDDNYLFTNEDNHIKLSTYNETKILNFDVDLSDGDYTIQDLGWDKYDADNCKKQIIVVLQNKGLKDGEEGVKVVYYFDPVTGKTDKKLFTSITDYIGSLCNYHF